MFDAYAARGHSRRPWTFIASLTSQLVVIASLAAVPLITSPSLAGALRSAILLEPPQPPSSSPPPERAAPPVAEERFELKGALTAPTRMPDEAAILIEDRDRPPAVQGPIGAVTLRVEPGSPFGAGVPGGIFRPHTPAVAPPPKPAVKPRATEPLKRGPIPVGGIVQAAKLVRRVEPIYPPLARQARISGTVRLEAIIARDGSIRQLSVASGHPLLVGAALEAVRQWRYRPTELNGIPVEVATLIKVRFRLR